MSNETFTPGDIYPGLSYDDPRAAIAWLCKVFGFEERLCVPGPDGGVIHSELSLGNAVIMVGSPRPEDGRLSPRSLTGLHQMLSVFVEDPDAHHARAKAAGAEVLTEVADTNFGARGYTAEDLEGHRWFFANYRPGVHWDDAGETDGAAVPN